MSERIAVDARGMALVILSTVAFLYALQWSQKFLIPLVFGILISYTLNPLVQMQVRIRVPRALAVTLVLLVLTAAGGATANTLITEFRAIVTGLPTAAHKLSKTMSQAQENKDSIFKQVQEAAAELAKATAPAPAAGTHAARNQASPEPPSFRFNDWVWAGSLSAAEFAGQTAMVLFLVFFMLLSGDTFKRKLVKLTGPRLTQKKITVQILDEINSSIQSYMFMLLVTNVMLGLMTWLALRWIGLENAGAWAFAAALLHLIPYFGPILIMVALGVSALLQFGTVYSVLLTMGVSLAIATLVGTFITTMMTGRIAKMNPAAVFIGLLFWGWLWGVWGLLLGVPIIVVGKVIAQHIEGLQSIAELLGE
ncbi:AI-2E family transporter [Noviherbaspirillum sp. DKR-6]|uniref:AI-2E family transporter n=1 Tax=Noviherbaspirillum pedocola TaxID=2801341 RepID=A0A934SZC6_9BURK|nr:AI-2E family transporter [Noviherbaspirillum pedocola]